MNEAAAPLPLYDVTARKVHQWAMVALVAAGFLLGGPVAVVLLAVAGLIMLLGRFWWQADVFRQLTWRLLEPYGVLRRREVLLRTYSERSSENARRAHEDLFGIENSRKAILGMLAGLQDPSIMSKKAAEHHKHAHNH